MIKRLAFLGSAATYLLAASAAYADIKLSPPDQGYQSIDKFLQNIITISFSIAAILVLGMMIWGAIEWIISGGEEKSVKSARGKITNALIGLAVLAVAWAITVLAGEFTGISLTDLKIPGPK